MGYNNLRSYGQIGIQAKLYTRWGYQLGSLYGNGTHVFYTDENVYGVESFSFVSGPPKLYTSTVKIPVNYDVGNSGWPWTTQAYCQDDFYTVDDSCTWNSPYTIVKGQFGFDPDFNLFSFVYGSTKAEGIELSLLIDLEPRNVSFTPDWADRIDNSRPPTITGNRNSPIAGDDGGNTSVTLGIRRYYKTDSWTCKTNNVTASHGGAISGARFDGNSVTLVGKLYPYKSVPTTYLDTLPIPEEPYSNSTDTIQLVDDSVSPVKTENFTVTRTRKYTFDSWNTKKDGTGTKYGGGGKDLSTSGFTENTTLYAQWKDATVSSSFLPSDWTSEKRLKVSDTPSSSATLQCFYNTKAFNNVYDSHTCYRYEYKGVKLAGWKGTDGSRISPGGPAGGCDKYTAIWELDPDTTSTHVWENNEYAPLVPEHRAGWAYIGLSTSATNKSPEYPHPANITITENMNLYAIWKAKGSGHLFDGSNYKMYQIYIYDGTSWKLYIPKIYNGSDWETVYM